jgi:hypothetical protein
MGHGPGLRLRTTGADREVEVSRTGAKEFGDTAVLPEPGGDVLVDVLDQAENLGVRFGESQPGPALTVGLAR